MPTRVDSVGSPLGEPDEGWSDWGSGECADAAALVDSINPSLISLTSKALTGDVGAIGALVELAIDACEAVALLERGDASSERLRECAMGRSGWPVLLPADLDLQDQTRSRIADIGVGSSATFKTYGGKGRPPDRSSDSPSSVARRLVMRLLLWRRDPRYGVKCAGPELDQLVGNLPHLEASSLEQWQETALALMKVQGIRDLFIPESWEKRRGDKSFGSYVNKTIKEGLSSVCRGAGEK